VTSYLANLTLRLTAGMARLPEEMRHRHAAYLAAAQQPDGGYAGRQGPSDPYYTSFALRARTMLGELDRPAADRVVGFLASQLEVKLPSVDFLSLLNSAMLVQVATGQDVFADAGRDPQQMLVDFAERLRRKDGGYAKTERGGQSSTYHTFLMAAAMQTVDVPIERADETVGLIRARQRDDGGFVELDLMRYSGANPTAAALGLLRMLDALDDRIGRAAAGFLATMQNEEGGLRAHARIPAADLLSTFTGVVALADLDALESIDRAAALRFVESLERPGGGFRAGAWDDTADVEYAFYGLGAEALLR
jgi:geranylgeranyl transferase type-2 subunit beta